MKWCYSVNDIPKGIHYAILEQRSISIPGDERSRTNPGHGYPASTEQIWNYIVFEDRDEWVAEVTRRASLVFGSKDYIAISAMPAVTTTTITVK